jgi:hypothetical protein
MNLQLDSRGLTTVRFIIPDDTVTGDPLAMDEEYGRNEHLLRLSGWLDMNCQLAVSCRENPLTKTS